MKYALIGLAALLFIGTAEAAPLPSLDVGESDTYTFEGNADLVVWVEWTDPGKIDATKDLSIDITAPSGFTQHCDDEQSGKQVCIIFGELEDGEYLIEVTNVGEKAVRYDYQAGSR